MGTEFEDYYTGIMEELSKVVPSKSYVRYLMRKNYFQIKTSFYEDVSPEEVIRDLKFQVVENEVSEKNVLTESVKTDLPTRTIVRDLINMVKLGQNKLFYLPEDINPEMMTYDFGHKIPYLSVEFDVSRDVTLPGDYLMNGGTSKDEDTIEIKLILNPDKFPNSYYDLVADLNDIVRHEMEHILQSNFMKPEDQMSPDEFEAPTDKEYYKQSHEVPAEIAGLRRIVKLRKQPIEKVIYDWFVRSQPVHNLNKEDIEELTDYLTIKYKEYYG